MPATEATHHYQNKSGWRFAQSAGGQRLEIPLKKAKHFGISSSNPRAMGFRSLGVRLLRERLQQLGFDLDLPRVVLQL